MTQAPVTRTEQARIAPVATAGNDLNSEVAQAPFAGTVTLVEYIPDATITGAATNNRTLSLVNKTQSLTVASLNFGNGTNAAAAAEKDLTLSGTAANLVVAQGDVLEFQSTHVGTGIADPGGLVRVQITRATAGA